ncbi:DUF1062 domain-containing protein [Micromonospora vinacea]|uniref:DUF1062 domain-containing protein n=1 Tax=Micromonospora vinacea TaxID=709878 RepID=UPI00344B3145
MSTRPHVVTSRTLRRTHLPLPGFRCDHCPSGLASTGDRTFGVNADGQLLDVLLLGTCGSCDSTSGITVHDRVQVRYLDPILPKLYSGNSSRRGPELGREARWPRSGLHRAAVRARSLVTGHDRRSTSARYRRRR